MKCLSSLCAGAETQAFQQSVALMPKGNNKVRFILRTHMAQSRLARPVTHFQLGL